MAQLPCHGKGKSGFSTAVDSVVLSGEPKSAVERPGNAREKSCRQTLVVLQHIYILRETSEFRSHGGLHSRLPVSRQYECTPTVKR